MIKKLFEINENKNNIRCLMYESDKESNMEKIILNIHGFSGHKENNAAAKFAERVISKYKGIALISFDLPCHGNDVKKKISLEDCLSYIDIVVNFIKQNYTKEIYVYSTSFGGYLTLKYMLDNKDAFTKSAMRCPAVNMYDVLKERLLKEENYNLVLKGKEIAVGYDRPVKISNDFLNELKNKDIANKDFIDISDKILVLHGTKDELVSFDFVKEFCDKNIIEFIPIDGANHTFQNPASMELAIKEIIKFFKY